MEPRLKESEELPQEEKAAVADEAKAMRAAAVAVNFMAGCLGLKGWVLGEVEGGVLETCLLEKSEEQKRRRGGSIYTRFFFLEALLESNWSGPGLPGGKC
jgi:hypothetical protein